MFEIDGVPTARSPSEAFDAGGAAKLPISTRVVTRLVERSVRHEGERLRAKTPDELVETSSSTI